MRKSYKAAEAAALKWAYRFLKIIEYLPVDPASRPASATEPKLARLSDRLAFVTGLSRPSLSAVGWIE